jgi:type I restriction enzyme S subunit
VSDERYVESPEIALRKGDVIISKDGTIGRVARIDDLPSQATLNGTMMLVRPKDTLNYRFLFHFLNGHKFQRLIEDKVSGSSIPHIFQRDMVGLQVDLPPLDEQARIATVLDTVDDAIAKTEAVIAKLKQVRIGLLHDLLTCGLDEHGQLRDPVVHTEQFKDSPIGRIPNGWDVGSFRTVASPDRTYLKTGPFGSSLKQEHWVSEGVPVVTIGSLGEGEFIHSGLLFVSAETASALSAYSLLPGDIVFSRVADVGRSAVVSETERGWIMSSNLMRISLDRHKVVSNYVQYNLAANKAIRAQIRGLVNAGGRDVANSAVMNSLIFPWPPIEEQGRITAYAHEFDKHIDLEQVQQQKLHLLKQGLMSDMLSGRVRVTDELHVTTGAAI